MAVLKNNNMKINILFFILFVISFASYGQTESGILVITVWEPNPIRPIHGYHYVIAVGNEKINANRTNTSPDTTIDFAYIDATENPSNIICSDVFYSTPEDVSCDIYHSIPYDKNTFVQFNFEGCLASSQIMGVHLISPGANNSFCIDQTISLDNGWNWEYQYDSGTWQKFPIEFQEQRAISFKIKELNGYEGKATIRFRAGFQTQFTNIVSYNIIPCSPNLVGIPAAEQTSCIYSSDGKVTFTFNDLKLGEEFETTLYNGKVLVPSNFKSISETQYTFTDLTPGDYKLKYNTKLMVDGVVTHSTVDSTTFKIDIPKALGWSAKPINPICHGDKGEILLEALGGTPPYYYIIGKEDTNKVMQFDENTKVQFEPLNAAVTSLTIKDLSLIALAIKVIDSKKCIEIPPPSP